MALRTSVTLVGSVAMLGLMIQSFGRQSQVATDASNDAALDTVTAILTDMTGVAGGSFPLLLVVAFVAGGLGVVTLLK